MLHTGRIYDCDKIIRVLEEPVLICVQRYPWKYIHRDWNVERLVELGPTTDLFDFVKNTEYLVLAGMISEDAIKSHYSFEYLRYLKSGSPKRELNQIIQLLLTGREVVLLCHEPAGEFCHRHLLSEFLISKLGEEYRGGEVSLELGGIAQ